MLAVDTNVLVRYLTNDEPKQAAKARQVIRHEDVLVPTTVLLETEWILRSVYGLSAKEIAGALRDLAGLPHVALEEPALAAQALDWMESGLDFADALHLAKAEQCDAFVTFDQALARRAAKLTTVAIRVP